MRHAAFLLLAASALAPLSGCSNDSSSSSTGDLAMSVDLLPLTCHGILSNAMNGTFSMCELRLNDTGNDVSINPVPTNYVPLSGQPQPSQVTWNLVAQPAFKLQKYTLDTFANGTFMQVTNPAKQATFIAQRQIDMNTGMPLRSGSIELTLTTLPKNPGGNGDWIDTTAHGFLRAKLPLDPNSPGTPGDYIQVDMDF